MTLRLVGCWLLMLGLGSPAQASPSGLRAPSRLGPTLQLTGSVHPPRLRVGRLLLVGVGGGFSAVLVGLAADEAGLGDGVIAGAVALGAVPWAMLAVEPRLRILPTTLGALAGGAGGVVLAAWSLREAWTTGDVFPGVAGLGSAVLLPGLGAVGGALLGSQRPEGVAVLPWLSRDGEGEPIASLQLVLSRPPRAARR